jgi:hypothetical protein
MKKPPSCPGPSFRLPGLGSPLVSPAFAGCLVKVVRFKRIGPPPKQYQVLRPRLTPLGPDPEKPVFLQYVCKPIAEMIAMKWKLWTRYENISPPDEGSEQFDSEGAARERACYIFRRQSHVKILRIEGPNGERIEAAEILAWCKERAARQ